MIGVIAGVVVLLGGEIPAEFDVRRAVLVEGVWSAIDHVEARFSIYPKRVSILNSSNQSEAKLTGNYLIDMKFGQIRSEIGDDVLFIARADRVSRFPEFIGAGWRRVVLDIWNQSYTYPRKAIVSRRISGIFNFNIGLRPLSNSNFANVRFGDKYISSQLHNRSLFGEFYLFFSRCSGYRSGVGSLLRDHELLGKSLSLFSGITPRVINGVAGGVGSVSGGHSSPPGEHQRYQETADLKPPKANLSASKIGSFLSRLCSSDVHAQGIFIAVAGLPAFGLVYGGSLYGLLGRRRRLRTVAWLGGGLGAIGVGLLGWLAISLPA